MSLLNIIVNPVKNSSLFQHQYTQVFENDSQVIDCAYELRYLLAPHPLLVTRLVLLLQYLLHL